MRLQSLAVLGDSSSCWLMTGVSGKRESGYGVITSPFLLSIKLLWIQNRVCAIKHSGGHVHASNKLSNIEQLQTHCSGIFGQQQVVISRGACPRVGHQPFRLLSLLRFRATFGLPGFENRSRTYLVNTRFRKWSQLHRLVCIDEVACSCPKCCSLELSWTRIKDKSRYLCWKP